MIDPTRIKLSKLGFTYRGSDRPAIEDIDLELRPGQMLAVLGANGAGKSTLVRTLNAIVPKFFRGEIKGEVRVGGLSPSDAGVAAMARKVGMVFQDFESQIFSTTCRSEVAFGMENMGMPPEAMRRRVPELLDRVGLKGFEGRSPAELSGGQKQRLVIASILAIGPDVLVLDEPTTDLDPKGKTEVWGLINELRAQGKTMIVIEHGHDALADADLALVLDHGAPAYIGPAEPLLLDPEFLTRHGVRPPDGAAILHRLGMRVDAWRPEGVVERIRRAGLTPREIPARAESDAGRQPLFAVHNLSFSYPHGPEVLHDVDLAIGREEIVALLGPNGSGKTTLVKLMSGLIPIKPGKGARSPVLYDGEPPGSAKGNRSALGRRIGFVFQDPDAQIFSATVFDEVAFGLRNFGVDQKDIPRRVAAALETVGLAGKEPEDPFVMTKGDRQKLAVASVLACEPETIVLDEPSTGLDEQELAGMTRLLAMLHGRGHTILMITHSLPFAAQIAQRCIVLMDGRVLADMQPRDLFADLATCEKAHLVPPDAAIIGKELGCKAVTVNGLVEALTDKARG